jgi:hypothetical protein
MHISGVGGLLLIPMLGVFIALPLLATTVGYFAESIYVSYAALGALTLVCVGLYGFAIDIQGRTLARREIEILDTVREPADE